MGTEMERNRHIQKILSRKMVALNNWLDFGEVVVV